MNNPAQRVLAVIALLASFCACLAQSNGPDTYRLQPEDIIRIQVYRVETIDATLPIGPDGNISAPFIGVVRAAGKTIAEFEHDLKAAYTDRLKLQDPLVSVTVINFRKIRASVGGYVGRAGVYDMRPGDRILDLLNSGGGTSTDGRADLRRAYLLKRENKERIPIDLRALLNGDNSQNYIVEDGDTLIIPEERDNRIVVAGRVRQEGPIQFRERLTVYEAITQAGRDQRRSFMSKIQVFRPLKGRPGDFLAIEVNLVAYERREDPTQNIVLQPGDLVYVPDNGNVDFELINSVANLFFIFDRFGFNPLDRIGLGRRNP
ncbi:polysaccharide biosynthesis/export family protein [Kamptonema cortianum]|nr:polysaccharide biosynthesis/export family protein [Geitlerinema splendidum]MDK3161038.1 polysaccharide biosynthesis/export family protein [Kamptonema cortianum]